MSKRQAIPGPPAGIKYTSILCSGRIFIAAMADVNKKDKGAMVRYSMAVPGVPHD